MVVQPRPVAAPLGAVLVKRPAKLLVASTTAAYVPLAWDAMGPPTSRVLRSITRILALVASVALTSPVVPVMAIAPTTEVDMLTGTAAILSAVLGPEPSGRPTRVLAHGAS